LEIVWDLVKKECKNFIIDKDYKILLTRKGEQDFIKNDEIISDSKKVLKTMRGS